MSKHDVKERGHAFENQYFNKLSGEKAKALKQKLEQEQNLEELKRITGITNDTLLEHILDQGLSASELAALSLFPIAQVAWADGTLDDNERKAIIKVCQEDGIQADSPAMALMETWLEETVDESLFSLWKDWVSSTLSNMSDEQAKDFSLSIIAKATKVAQASRSFLGLGPAISSEEQKVIDQIKSALK